MVTIKSQVPNYTKGLKANPSLVTSTQHRLSRDVCGLTITSYRFVSESSKPTTKNLLQHVVAAIANTSNTQLLRPKLIPRESNTALALSALCFLETHFLPHMYRGYPPTKPTPTAPPPPPPRIHTRTHTICIYKSTTTPTSRPPTPLDLTSGADTSQRLMCAPSPATPEYTYIRRSHQPGTSCRLQMHVQLACPALNSRKTWHKGNFRA